MRLAFQSLSLQFPIAEGGSLPVLDKITASVEEGEFICLLGPSGCGKSTLLNVVAGLLSPTEGSVVIGDVEITAGARALPSGIGYVFQEPRLLDWMSVEKNLLLTLKPLGLPAAERAALIRRYLDMVGLYAFKDTYPQRLSGGMQSRISLIRALIISPQIILMDEPLNSVDAITAMRIRGEFVRLLEAARPTILFVTHNIGEAVYFADRIFLMTNRPTSIYREIRVTLPRPRSTTSRELTELEAEIGRILVEEILPD
ncbi:MAG: ABC transporter ATP-binding protein [Candidatus Tectomicrobia bacterium]|nr:ABC transporter ATP-binding protein [Candidatus Tectomicrobia bacterium]